MSDFVESIRRQLREHPNGHYGPSVAAEFCDLMEAAEAERERALEAVGRVEAERDALAAKCEAFAKLERNRWASAGAAFGLKPPSERVEPCRAGDSLMREVMLCPKCNELEGGEHE